MEPGAVLALASQWEARGADAFDDDGDEDAFEEGADDEAPRALPSCERGAVREGAAARRPRAGKTRSPWLNKLPSVSGDDAPAVVGFELSIVRRVVGALRRRALGRAASSRRSGA